MAFASTATSERSAPKAKRPFTIIHALDSEKLFKPWFRGESWGNWRIVLKAAYGLPLTADEIIFFKSIAGGREPPDRQVRELWIIAGRRAGKDAIVSAVAAYSAALFDKQDRLRRGERASIACLAVDRAQSRIILDYIKAFFSDIPMLKSLVAKRGSTAIGFKLENLVDVEVTTNNFRSVRGRPFAVVILDECAYYMSETSATPDVELYKAIVPGMATLPNSMIIGISTPYKRSGLLFQKYRDHFGRNGDVLVIQAPTTTLNPTIDSEIVARALAEDPAAASAEWLGEFRSDIEAFISREAVEGSVDVGIFERGYIAGQRYHACVDPSGGSSDSMTLAVAHIERRQQGSEKEKVVIVDAVREIKPPFSPEATVDAFCQLLQSYHVTKVCGDRYAGEWPRERFRVHGVAYEPSEKPKSDLSRSPASHQLRPGAAS